MCFREGRREGGSRWEEGVGKFVLVGDCVKVLFLLQAEILIALKGGMELITTFTTQLSTFHSYLEQVCGLTCIICMVSCLSQAYDHVPVT